MEKNVGGLFFVSSSRRHTRSTRDWSSDVCASDLPQAVQHHPGPAGQGDVASFRSLDPRGRSEERRVGKECRSRGSPYHYKKKQNGLDSVTAIIIQEKKAKDDKAAIQKE